MLFGWYRHVCRYLPQRLDVRLRHRADERLEHVFLAVEVEVDRALADPGARRNVFQPGSFEALFEKLRERRVQHFGGARFLPSLPALGLGRAHDRLINN